MKNGSVKGSKVTSGTTSASLVIKPGRSGCQHTRDAIYTKGSVILRSYELAIRVALACRGGVPDKRIASDDENDSSSSESSKQPPRKRPRKGEPASLLTSSYSFNPTCGTCRQSSNLFLCLECSFTGCIGNSHDPHSFKTGHKLGVDLSTRDGFLYCFSCADYIYDDQFEQVRIKKIQQVFSTIPETSTSITKDLQSVVDEEDEKSSKSFNTRDSVTPSFQATTALKGFYNMGATCFMSVILQSLIHNPLVRNFFLAGGHDSDECEQPNCLACCVDQVFTDFFANSTVQGFGMTAILTASFNIKKSLAGASEQDAHEFLQFILDEFHKTHFQGKIFEQVTKKFRELDDITEGPFTPSNNDDTCNCVSHRTFYGQLESRIKCQTCGNITATIDPMMDLSLEIKSIPKKSKRIITLNDCLDRFTGSEKLDSTYYCSRCDTRRIVDKQLFVKRLPTVLSIQLKVRKIFSSPLRPHEQY